MTLSIPMPGHIVTGGFLAVMNFYRPPTKLQEDKVFSRVCLSVHWGEGRFQVTIAHDTLDPPPPPQHGTSLCRESPAQLPRLTWDLTVGDPPPPSADTWCLLKHVPIVGKWPIRILLECFLVFRLITMAPY